MRISFLAALLGLSLVACTVGDTIGGDDEAAICGNATSEGGETCDDGNTVDGDGCSATCQAEPGVDSSVDKTSISTELNKTETITLTLASLGGFAGEVGVTATVVDAASAPIPGVIVAGPTSLTLAADQTIPAQYIVTIASNATGEDLAATVRLALTSSLGSKDITSVVSIAPILTMLTAAGTGVDRPKHPAAAKNIPVRRGTRIRFTNADTIVHITHGGGIFAHEDQNSPTSGLPGNTYEQPTVQGQPGQQGTLGCHNHEDDATYATFTVQ